MIGASDERMTILRMIESNKITVEQGSLLLGALGKPGEQAAPAAPVAAEPVAEAPSPASKAAGSGRRFRVLITDSVTGKNKVSVNLPLSLVRWGLHTGKKFSAEMDGIDVDELAALLEGGEDGQFIEVFDEEDGEHVRVFIE
jgi:hypothetical protein